MTSASDELAWLVPASLEDKGELPRERFSSAEMKRQLRVLFIVHQAELAPAIAVHADLMRALSRDRVRIYAAVARNDARGIAAPMGRTSRSVLSQIPDLEQHDVCFGPTGGGGARALAAAAIRTAGPALRDFAALARMVRRERIDVIHCEQQVLNGFYGYLLSRVTGVPYLIHLHSNYGAWMRRPAKFAVARAAAVVGVSRWNGETAHLRGGVPAGRIYPVLNGIDLRRWDHTISGDAVRDELGVGRQDPLIVQVAQVTPWKRQALVIEAFREVRARFPDARLLLVGVQWNAAYLAELRALIRDSGLQDAVTLAGVRRDIPEVLAAADFVAHPPEGEPFGLAFVEAMAMGKPVVSVRSGATPEVVEDGTTGLLSPLDEAGPLAANMISLLEDPARRTAMGEQARRRVEELFTAERMAAQLEAVYRMLAVRNR